MILVTQKNDLTPDLVVFDGHNGSSGAYSVIANDIVAIILLFFSPSKPCCLSSNQYTSFE
jgi:hypothetical protein